MLIEGRHHGHQGSVMEGLLEWAGPLNMVSSQAGGILWTTLRSGSLSSQLAAVSLQPGLLAPHMFPRDSPSYTLCTQGVWQQGFCWFEGERDLDVLLRVFMQSLVDARMCLDWDQTCTLGLSERCPKLPSQRSLHF